LSIGLEEILSDFEGKRMVLNHSGNDLKNGNLSTGMGGRFRPELVAGLNRNGWQVYAGICTDKEGALIALFFFFPYIVAIIW
jgi:hypothetical protein